MSFGARLRAAREAAELYGDELGGQIGVSKQTISHWEHDRYEPNIEQIKALCAVLKVSADWLFGLSSDKDLPQDVIEEARVLAKLPPADRRRWRVLRQAMFTIPGVDLPRR